MPTMLKPSALARVVKPIVASWLRRPETPSRLVLSLTRRCNLRCEMCHTYELTPGDELSALEIERLCGALPHLSWLDVTGGEIFLRGDILEVFDAVARSAPRLGVFHFPTNGWFEARVLEAVTRLRAARPDVELIVTVSVDGPRAVHDRIRGREGSFDRALATYRALRALDGVHAYVGTTVTRSNNLALDALHDALVEALPSFEPREWHWNFYQRSGHFFGNDHDALAPDDASALAMRQLQRRGLPRGPVDLMECLFLLHLERYAAGEALGFACQALHSSAFVSADGQLFPCHVYDRPLGALRAEAFDVRRVWATAGVRAARRDIEALVCGGCFTPCEAYPTLAGAPLGVAAASLRRGAAAWWRAYGTPSR